MKGALKRAATAAIVGTATTAVVMAATAIAYQTPPLTLATKYWFVYGTAVALPTVALFACAAINNWIASGDPQKEM